LVDDDEFMKISIPGFAEQPINDIDTGPNCAAIVGGDSDQIALFDGDNWVVYGPSDDSFPISDLLCTAIDHSGIIWVGTPEDGLWRLDTDAGSSISTQLSIVTDRKKYSGGEMRVSIDLTQEGKSKTADFYLAAELPSGDLLFYPGFVSKMTPFLTEVEIPADTHIEDYELLNLTLPFLSPGTYHWHVACMNAGTTEFGSNIASCEWQFE
ncbi:MAG: hypothetical protein JW941_01065, partial [Candidatus Coatesbacteria bacterium]|nr:hypothetical protein [Candidatus Coatesbacteria bacterium]